MNESQIFAEALRRGSPAERAAFLDEACGADNALRAHVDALLRAAESDESFLDRPAGRFGVHQTDATRDFVPAVDETQDLASPGAVAERQSGNALGEIIAGRYCLSEILGEGGMGTVYVADQSEPVRRRVALKLIKAGMDSQGVLARFDAERQALALMDHPNIARIYDGGVTPTGQPFFVMELVQGATLTEYCDSKCLSVNARLELFVQVCQAVQHAHQKGIIHRDLKPGNVLVTEVDGRPTPKVIDFGVAKATGPVLTEIGISEDGVIVGTPAYMSPEQADPGSLDIDTRTDVYALGIVLYELLTGSPPIDAKQFRRGAIHEMLRMVREVEPPRPSTKLSTSEGLPNIAAKRNTQPARLSKLLKGELDWVVMKALEKDRTRRYDTANGLARDIQRFLADEVVEARPPSRGYRIRKFARRNRVQVFAAGLVLLALIAGISGTTSGLLAARRQQKIAEDARIAESARAEGERQANETAQRRLQDVARSNEILSSIFLALNPDEVRKEERPLRVLLTENLEAAADRMRADGVQDPEIAAKTQMVFGVSMMNLGSPKKALGLLESARDAYRGLGGPDHPRALVCESNIAQAMTVDGRLRDAVEAYETILPRIRSVHGPEADITLTSMNNLGTAYKEMKQFDKALPLLEEALRIRRSKPGDQPDELILSINALGSCHQDSGRHKEAQPLFEEAFDLAGKRYGPNHVKTLVLLNNISGIHFARGRLEDAAKTSREALAGLRRVLGNDHSIVLVTTNNLASYLKDLKRFDEARPLFEEIYRIQNAKAGPDHPLTINFLMNLAGIHMQAGETDKAIPLMGDAARRRLKSLGPDNDLTERQIVTFLNLCKRFQKYDGAESLLEETVRLSREKPGPTHPRTLGYLLVYASFCNELKKPEIGVPILEEIVAIRRTALGAEAPLTEQAISNLGTGYWRFGQPEKAIPLFEELVRAREKRLGRGHPDTLLMLANLGVNIRDAGRPADAVPLLRECVKASERHPALAPVVWDLMAAYQRAGMTAELKEAVDDSLRKIQGGLWISSSQKAGALAQIATHLVQEKAWALSEPILRECLDLRIKAEPEAWTTFNTQSMLGGALLGQKKSAEAEPLLLKGYEGMKAREKTIPPQGSTRIPEALDRLIELYSATNKPDEVKKWQTERAKYSTDPIPMRRQTK